MTGAERLSPYEAILGTAFQALHPVVRRAHSAPLVAEGIFDVVHGTHRMTPALVRLLKLPATGAGVPVALRLAVGPVSAPGRPFTLRWDRRIGQTPLSTEQCASRGLLIETSGLGRMVFSLRVVNGCLEYTQAACRVLLLPVPSRLSPHVSARVSPDLPGWHVEVSVEWRGHLICRYSGSMRPVQATP